MEIREFKNFMVVFISLCIFKLMINIDFSSHKTPKRIELTKTIKKEFKHNREEICKVVVTMYNAVEGQCDSDPYTTASMKTINPSKASDHKWIAMSRNLLKRWGGRGDYGNKIKLSGCGEKDGIYTIVDCMNERYVNRIDILETEGTPLYKYENVKITFI